MKRGFAYYYLISPPTDVQKEIEINKDIEAIINSVDQLYFDEEKNVRLQ